MALNVERQPQRWYADAKRVIAKPFILIGEARIRQVVERVLALDEAQAQAQFEHVMTRYAPRHRHFEIVLERNYARVAYFVPEEYTLTEERKLLLGAFFTHEYSIEAAALFNPSIVLHPDQSGVAEGEARVIMSFRATGEGHISSVEFRSGVVDANGGVHLEPVTRFTELPEVTDANPIELRFPPDTPLSERVLFPVTQDERNGIEDVRMVRFVDDDGSVRYYGTYTAFDGTQIRPKLFETTDFVTFRLLSLVGAAAANKGLALFPRRINGQYVMLGRQDNERNFVMVSDDLFRWEEASLLRGPEAPWEIIQIGNCGSPLETEAGWLVLTHGVGPMREYTLGADLLDLDDPTRIIGRLDQPLLAPDDGEREGYVPNVLYTCGALLHGEWIVIPYAMSDAASGVATVSVRELLKQLA